MRFSYDKRFGMFYVYRMTEKTKSKTTIGDGKIVVDIDANNEIIGVELIDAAKVLKEHSERSYEEIKEILENLTDCYFDFKVKDDVIMINMRFVSKTQDMTPTFDIRDKRILSIA